MGRAIAIHTRDSWGGSIFDFGRFFGGGGQGYRNPDYGIWQSRPRRPGYGYGSPGYGGQGYGGQGYGSPGYGGQARRYRQQPDSFPFYGNRQW